MSLFAGSNEFKRLVSAGVVLLEACGQMLQDFTRQLDPDCRTTFDTQSLLIPFTPIVAGPNTVEIALIKTTSRNISI
jgi:hypothetical protein